MTPAAPDGTPREAAPGPGASPPDPGRVPLVDTVWRPSHRLIPSRYPTVGLYDRIADPADLDVVFAIEALTNARIRDEIGQLQLVRPEDRISGPGSTPVMAAFTHLNPEGSRFSDGRYGVYYAARSLDTAIAEVSHHRAAFLARTAEPEIDVDLREIVADVRATLHDLCGLGAGGVPLFDPSDYAVPQAFARRLREAGSAGVVFPSVRHPGGLCVGLFRPKALDAAKPGRHIGLHWDGQRITHWYEKRSLHALPPPKASPSA